MESTVSLEQSYNGVIKKLDGRAKLLAVSKYQAIDDIKSLSDLGQSDFGENYLQELELKFAEMPHLNWHFIGALQSRKIKGIVKCVDTIHSVASMKHLQKIDVCAQSLNKVVNVLLQVNIDNDPNKSGFVSNDISNILTCIESATNMRGVQVIGLMCLPAKLDSSKDSFVKMQKMFNDINSQLDGHKQLKQLSMGMSGDYLDAIDYGSTMVRIGSSIFGERKAKN